MDRDWTASFSIRFRNDTCIIILDKKYNITNSSCHFGSYGSIWTGPSLKKYYMDLRSFGLYNIFLVTDWSIYCHMTLSAMNYLLYKPWLCNKNVDIKVSVHFWNQVFRQVLSCNKSQFIVIVSKYYMYDLIHVVYM